MIHTSLQYASILYEALSSWLFLSFAAQRLSADDVTITALTVIIVLGLIYAIGLIILYRSEYLRYMTSEEKPEQKHKKAQDYFRYLF